MKTLDLNIPLKGSYLTTSSYDGANRVKKLIYPEDIESERKELIPSYNKAGALEKVVFDGNTYVEHIAYDSKGQRLLIAYGNGTMTRYAYNKIDFSLTRQKTEKYTKTGFTFTPQSGNNRQDTAYRYDQAGNILKILERKTDCGILDTPLGVNALDRTFTYDPLYRLLTANGRECNNIGTTPDWENGTKCTDSTMARAYERRYSYDKMGNILNQQHIANNAFTKTFNYTTANKNYLNSIDIGANNYNFTYDAVGNILNTYENKKYQWNYANQMQVFKNQINNSEPTVYAYYFYNSSGERTKKIVRKANNLLEVSIYIDGMFEHRYVKPLGTTIDPNKNYNLLHLSDDKTKIAEIKVGTDTDDSTPNIKYLISNNIDSVSYTLDTNGTIINSEEYYPFGETSFGSHTKKSYRFSGKECDNESGLYYYGARYYLPYTCRFLNVDPWKDKYPWQSSYAYYQNNPINTGDYFGLGGDPEINEENGTATITAQVHFIKDSSVTDEEFDDYLNEYTNNLEAVFQDKTYTKDDKIYKVVLNVSYSIINNKNDLQDASSSDNFVTVRSGGGVSNAEKGGDEASMNINDKGNTATHEFLHLLGLDDRYQFAQKAKGSSGEVPTADYKVLSMPRGQVNEPIGYEAQNNIMANAATSNITDLQFDYIFKQKIEDNGMATIFHTGNYKGGDVLGIVDGNIVDGNNTEQSKSEYLGYANEDFSITDDGRYFRLGGKPTSFGEKVEGYKNNSVANYDKRSYNNFMAPYNR